MRPRPRRGRRVSVAILEPALCVRGPSPALEAASSHQCLALSWLQSEFSSTQALLCSSTLRLRPWDAWPCRPLGDGLARSVPVSFMAMPGSGAGGLGHQGSICA